MRIFRHTPLWQGVRLPQRTTSSSVQDHVFLQQDPLMNRRPSLFSESGRPQLPSCRSAVGILPTDQATELRNPQVKFSPTVFIGFCSDILWPLLQHHLVFSLGKDFSSFIRATDARDA